MDFKLNATVEGRLLKLLNVIDEHSRLCLAIRVGRRCKAKDVVTVLEELISIYPAPAFIRSDNGPEFIAHALRSWSKPSGTTTAYIEPGSPWQNGFAESYELRSTASTTAGLGTVPQHRVLRHGGRGPGPGQSLALGVQHPQAAFGPLGAYASGGSSSSCCIIAPSHYT
jgi:putative transposase